MVTVYLNGELDHKVPPFTCWLFVVFVDFTQHQFVLASTEGVFEQRHGRQVHVRVGPLSLVRAGPIEVPLGAI